MTDSELHIIEATIRYLTSEEGGRRHSMYNDYRGQFYYAGEDCDGFQFFPDVKQVQPGDEVRAFVRFRQERWQAVHQARIFVGMPFQIREGARTVGEGVVTRLNVPIDEFLSCLNP